MYPFLRYLGALVRARRAEPLPVFGTDTIRLRCLPIDIDPFFELNNGRVLTLFDLGRFSLGQRVGLVRALRQNRWGLAVAGASIRYRARVKAFQRVEIRTRTLSWDPRFFYMEQAMWRGETCCSHVLIRVAITNADGIVPTATVADAMGLPDPPPLPQWVAAWVAAEAERPWPPTL